MNTLLINKQFINKQSIVFFMVVSNMILERVLRLNSSHITSHITHVYGYLLPVGNWVLVMHLSALKSWRPDAPLASISLFPYIFHNTNMHVKSFPVFIDVSSAFVDSFDTLGMLGIPDPDIALHSLL